MDEQLNEFLQGLPTAGQVSIDVLRINGDGSVQEDFIDRQEFEGVESVLIDRYYIVLFLGEGGIRLFKHDIVYNVSMSADVTIQSWELKEPKDSRGGGTL